MSLTACYLEGSSCSGPLCVSVATDFDDHDHCHEDCDHQNRCPDADSTKILARNAINSIRQSSVSFNCASQPGTLVPLVWNETLFSAADRQARDMAANNYVDGLGSDGISVDARVSELDSSLSNVNQIVAGGFSSPRVLINEWVRQSDDCAQLMSNAVSDFAMACRYDRNSDYGTYWSLVLARASVSGE